MPGTVAIIQARLGSTRLRGKVLLPLAGEPMLQRVIARTKRARLVDEVLVATTTNAADQPVAEFAAGLGCGCFRGDEHDVLDRYFQTASSAHATEIVRITSDCPFIDPGVIDQVIQTRRERQADYAANIIPRRTFPRGLDVEVFTFATLERCWHSATDASSREHVTAFIYRHPEQFQLAGLEYEADLSAHRWTVDTPEDYALAAQVYSAFGHDRFAWQEILPLLAAHPEWAALNAHVEQKAQ